MVAVLLLRHSWARLFTGAGMLCGLCCIMRAAPVQVHHAPPCGMRSYHANLALPPCRFRPSVAAHSKRAAGICADASWRRLQCCAPRPAQVRCFLWCPPVVPGKKKFQQLGRSSSSWAEVRASTAQHTHTLSWCWCHLSRRHTARPASLLLDCRGSGRQGTGALANLCSYWILGIPSAYYLAFR